MRRGRARPFVLLFSLCALTLGVVAFPSPAHAAGVGTVEFSASGTLWTFPTPAGHTDFWGQATGTATLTGISGGGRVTTADIWHLTMPVSGWVDYGEPGFPLCPLIGAAGSNLARGQITVGAPTLPISTTTGATYTAGYTNTGVVTGVVYRFDLSYSRVGAAATVLFGVPPGSASVTVYFSTPGHGSDSFTVPIVAAGEAAFYTDFVQATMNCKNGGGPALNYVLTGVLQGVSA